MQPPSDRTAAAEQLEKDEACRDRRHDQWQRDDRLNDRLTRAKHATKNMLTECDEQIGVPEYAMTRLLSFQER